MKKIISIVLLVILGATLSIGIISYVRGGLVYNWFNPEIEIEDTEKDQPNKDENQGGNQTGGENQDENDDETNKDNSVINLVAGEKYVLSNIINDLGDSSTENKVYNVEIADFKGTYYLQLDHYKDDGVQDVQVFRNLYFGSNNTHEVSWDGDDTGIGSGHVNLSIFNNEKNYISCSVENNNLVINCEDIQFNLVSALDSDHDIKGTLLDCNMSITLKVTENLSGESTSVNLKLVC